MTATSALIRDAWKPCDLRGVFPEAVSPALFHRIGRAVATLLPLSARFVVAGDYRLSTPDLKHALIDGLLQSGAAVLDAGQGPTPLAYFTAQQLHADAALIVTASHNPPQDNGLKLMINSVPTTPRQLSQIRDLAEGESFRLGAGSIESIDLRNRYLNSMLKRWVQLRGRRGRRVILDAGNGAWSELAPRLFRRLGFEVICLSCKVDGSFPERPADCARAENLTRLSDAVRSTDGAIGIAWDGDGDRAAFIDETGNYVSPDEIAILFARDALAGMPSDTCKVVVDLKHSDAVRRAVLEAGGLPLLERTGHAFMRGRMVVENALLGLDACGHYFFQELEGGDDGLFSALYLLDLVRRSGRSLHELRDDLPRIFSTPELRIPVATFEFADAARALQQAFPGATTTTLDGLRLLLPEGVVLLRESGTEHVLSLRIEGFDRPGFENVHAQCISALPSLAAFLHRESEDVPTNRIQETNSN